MTTLTYRPLFFTTILLTAVSAAAQDTSAAATEWTTAIPLVYPDTADDLKRLGVTTMLVSAAGQQHDTDIRIEDARQAFWKTYPSQANRAIALTFADMLLTKELWFLVQVLTMGRDGVAGPINELLMKLIDNGIPAEARPQFDAWVESVRTQLGARRPQDQVINNIDYLLPALAASRRAYLRYHSARDFAELDAAGRELEWVKDGRTFTIMLGIRYLDMLPAEAENEYRELARVFGKPVVDQVGERLRAARRTKGRLTDLPALGLQSSRIVLPGDDDPLVSNGVAVVAGSTPLVALRALVGRDDPERFLKARSADRGRISWAEVTTTFDTLVAAYGRQALLAAAGAIVRAPVHSSGVVDLPDSPGVSVSPFGAILSVAARRDAKGFARNAIAVSLKTSAAAAIDSEYRRLASLKGEPALVEVAGQIIKLAHTPKHLLSSAAAAAQSRARLDGDQVHDLIKDMLTGRVVLDLSTAAAIPNPRYVSWAGYRPGATATLVGRTWTERDAGVNLFDPRATQPAPPARSSQKTISQETWVLESVSAERAIVRYRRSGPAGPSERDYVDRAGFPAAGHGDQMGRPWINDGNLPAHGKLTEDQGEADCGVARLRRCRWLSQTDSAGDVSQTMTVWLSDEVPGGLVRQVTETRARTLGSSEFFEVRLENWTGMRDPAARASTLDALARAYPPAPRSTSAPASYPPLPSSVTGELPLSTIPAGTVVVVRTRQPILYDTARIGSTFGAELAEPLIVGGRTIADAGSAAYLKYLQDMEASRRQRRPIVYVALDTVMVRGTRIPVPGADSAKASMPTRGPVVNIPSGSLLTFTAR